MRGLSVIVLGSAAGGGYPQWNCRCAVCRLAWAGDSRVESRTQTGLAVSGDGQNWVLVNASPDLRTQIMRTQALQPSRDGRDSPIKAVLLTGAEVDQCVGLLDLRERQPFTLYATAETFGIVEGNPIFRVLQPSVVERRTVPPDMPVSLPGGVTAELFTVPGKIPLFLEGEEPQTASESATTVGVELRAEGSAGSLVFAPSVAAITPAMEVRLNRAAVVLFDGTLFTDDEMIRTNTGPKTGRRMGHMPIGGEGGSLAALADLGARRIFIHINNTNPILVSDSDERRIVHEAGWDVAYDGQEIVL